MNFNKIGIVIGHEYSVRVRKKSFLLTTLLTPILMGVLICVPVLIALWGGNEEQTVKVVDKSGAVASYFEDSGNVKYVNAAEGEDLAVIQECFDAMDIYAAVEISDFDENGDVAVTTISREPLNMEIKIDVTNTVNKAVEDHKLAKFNLGDLDEILESCKTDIKINALTLKDDGEAKEDSVELYMALSYLMSFMIYLFVFIFGTMVMRSVIDEKSSRVVEVVVSSVKSTELMIGKIVGVALVALTQFIIWIVLTLAIVAAVNAFAGPELLQASAQDPEAAIPQILNQVATLNWGYILACFVAYFLLGYLLYASMFAAIGAAVDNESDTSQLQLPVTIPLMIGLFIMLHTFEHPNSQLSFWASIIPFTSPMVMLARIPFGVVPGWELALSLVLLFLTFLGIAYLSAKIYKAGILMYGKKSSFKDLWHWMKQKN